MKCRDCDHKKIYKDGLCKKCYIKERKEKEILRKRSEKNKYQLRK